MLLELDKMRPADAYKLMISALVPRPIAWISTQSAGGDLNLAPFSFFMGAGSNPPMIAVSIDGRSGEPKDTARNIRETGEFVINIVTEETAEAMNVTSGEYTYGENEFLLAHLVPAPSSRVKPPRVSESPVNFECRVMNIFDIGNNPNTLVLGEILCIHVRDDLWLPDKSRVDTVKLHAVGRLGGAQYTRVRDLFEMIRPKVERS